VGQGGDLLQDHRQQRLEGAAAAAGGQLGQGGDGDLQVGAVDGEEGVVLQGRLEFVQGLVAGEGEQQVHAEIGQEGDLARPLVELELARHLFEQLPRQRLEQAGEIGRIVKVAMGER
jgi:hypothetical protein